MNWEEFEKLTVKRCCLCEEQLDCETTAAHDKLIYTCKCTNVKAIFKNDKVKHMLYYYLFLPNYGGQVMLSGAREDTQYIVSVNSWNKNLTFRSDHVRVWIQDEHKVKNKIDSLMVLK